MYTSTEYNLFRFHFHTSRKYLALVANCSPMLIVSSCRSIQLKKIKLKALKLVRSPII